LFPKKCSKPTTEDFTVALNKPKNTKSTSKKTICFSSSQKPIMSGKADRQFPEVGQTDTTKKNRSSFIFDTIQLQPTPKKLNSQKIVEKWKK